MSQDSTQVVEKRVKSTVIRRRKEIVVAPPEEEIKVPAKKEAVSPVVLSQAAVKPVKEEAQKSVPHEGPAVVISEKKTPSVEIPLTILPGTELTVEDEEEKKSKYKKIVKKKEGELEVDLEGVGKIATITQLTRLAHVDRVERVFEPSKSVKKKKIISRKGLKKTPLTITKAAKRIVEMDRTIRVGDLAHAIGVKAAGVIGKLMNMGMMATINSELDLDTATLVAHEFQFEVKNVAFDETRILEEGKQEDILVFPRPPVVTVMGHVDHGKTSLLDAIRRTNVTEGEAGGITQHIGAYTVELPKGKITFLDTPGHEAFTAMRARGAKVTDIVILVVAADDGLMPQTLESIDHAKAAQVPIVVAVNKIDKPEANVERVKRQLSEQGLAPEEWGGETQYALVSAKQKTGIDELLEKVLLQAEILELKAPQVGRAKGVVIEARLDRQRGPVSTVLIQQGTLKVGDVLVAGPYWGKVRAMINDWGTQVDQALPSEAVELLGLEAVPSASDVFHVVEDEQKAREICEHRKNALQPDRGTAPVKVSLEDLFSKIQQGKVRELAVLIKTDVHGSLEAVSESLKKLSTPKVQVKIIHGGVGGITESDVLLSAASRAIIIGFNVRPETKAIKVAQTEQVQIKLYKIIYDMVNDVKLAMEGLLAPTRKETYLGRAEVRQTFTVSKVGTVAGCMVVDGKISRSAEIRLLRDNVVVHEGKIASLKREKDDAREVQENLECGIAIEGYQDIKQGDVIEAYQVELIKTEL